MNADGSEVQKLISVPDRIWHGSPHWSHDGKRIVFDAASTEKNRGGDSHIYVVAADGSLDTLKDLGLGSVPAWSPNDSKIAFYIMSRNPDRQKPGVWIMNSDGSDRRWLSEGRRPRWSPDGTRILIESEHEGFSSLYIVHLSGSTRLLGGDYDRIVGGTWSPDGKRVAFIGRRFGQWELGIMSFENRKEEVQVRLAGNIGWIPHWSPDGKQIAFFFRKGRDKYSIHTVNPDTDDPPRMLAGQEDTYNSDPCWSPNSRRIAFSSDRDS